MATEVTSAAANPETNKNLDPILATADEAGLHKDKEEYPSKVLNDLWSPPCPLPNLFATVDVLHSTSTGSVLRPLYTFTSGHTAFHLNYDPSINQIPIKKATEMFNLPDLQPALTDFLNHGGVHLHLFGGQRHTPLDVHLPFNDLQIWYKVCIQQMLYHDPSSHVPVRTINTQPPDHAWEYGHYDAAILQVDAHPNGPLVVLQVCKFWYSAAG